MDKNFKVFLITGITIAVVSCIYGVIILNSFNDIEKAAMFGDSFGALNAVISGLAFAGLITAILIQKTELQHQREELQLQRNEMALNREEMKLQREELNKTREGFLLERTTSIVYNQLERFEKVIDRFSLDDDTNGVGSFLYLENLSTSNELEKFDECIKRNLESVAILADGIYNTTHVVENQILLLRHDLGIWNLTKMQHLFFRNIGSTNLDILKLIRISLSRLESHFNLTQDFKYQSELTFKSRLSLEGVLDFRHMILNDETLKILDQRERNK